jgi:hypothetical protein
MKAITNPSLQKPHGKTAASILLINGFCPGLNFTV